MVPSGTMANQVALLRADTAGRRGDRLRRGACLWHETGGVGEECRRAVHRRSAPAASFTADELDAGDQAARPHACIRRPRWCRSRTPTTAPAAWSSRRRRSVAICALAASAGIATYLDGARLWNVAAATGLALAELAAPFDRRSVALSKGLGAPGGSMLAGPQAADRRLPSATAGCSAGRCGRSAFLPRRRFTRSTTTWNGSPRITPTRA